MLFSRNSHPITGHVTENLKKGDTCAVWDSHISQTEKCKKTKNVFSFHSISERKSQQMFL